MHDFSFFYETAFYHEDNESQQNDAKEYLTAWKCYFIQKMAREMPSVEFVDEQWIKKESIYSGSITQNVSLSLKLKFKGKAQEEI